VLTVNLVMIAIVIVLVTALVDNKGIYAI
jgi:hypothetical protein